MERGAYFETWRIQRHGLLYIFCQALLQVWWLSLPFLFKWIWKLTTYRLFICIKCTHNNGSYMWSRHDLSRHSNKHWKCNESTGQNLLVLKSSKMSGLSRILYLHRSEKTTDFLFQVFWNQNFPTKYSQCTYRSRYHIQFPRCFISLIRRYIVNFGFYARK